MAKIKISEFAGQLNRKSSEIISTLEALGINNNGKRFIPASNIDEEIAQKVKEKLGIKVETVQKEEPRPMKMEPEKKEVPEKKEAQEAPKKKIFMVSNPQNSSQARKNGKKSSKLPAQGQKPQRQAQNNKLPEHRAQEQVHEQKPVQKPVLEQKIEQKPEQKPMEQKKVQKPEQKVVQKAEQKPVDQKPIQKTDQKLADQKPMQKADQKLADQKPIQKADQKLADQKPIQKVDQKLEEQKPIQKADQKLTQKVEQKLTEQKPVQKVEQKPGQKPAEQKPVQRPIQKQNNDQRQGAQRQNFQQGQKQNNDRKPYQNNKNGKPDQQIKGSQKGKPEVKVEALPEKKNDRRADKFQERERDRERENGRSNRQEKPILQKNNQVKKEPVKQEPKEPEIKIIQLGDTITIKELAEKMKLQPAALVKKMFLQGKVVTINQEVDFATAEEIALEFDIIAEQEVKVDVIEELLKEEEEDENNMISRPPVICVMGHVDHGKTSLLDAIRSTNVTSREAGGITQHIGAYVVEINGEKITFLDTPGHEAFTAMRMRGAQSTDIAVLVVAADDGVMPQTIEAINHAKAAGIEIIVAINKIDKPSANIDRVKQELIEYELVAEDWGGSTVFVPVSAHTGEGIENLLEMILLTAEVKELKANPKRRARGLVIEAQLDKGKGPVATVLVQKGTLHVGDVIAAGASHGKVRAMIDDKGRRVKEALPSTPVEILGLNDVPNAGEIFVACENEKEARSFAETFISQGKEKLLEETKAKMSLDDLFSKIQAGSLKELNIIVKADVQGSVEAMRQSLLKLSNEEVVVKVIHGGVGAINESDVILASASNAIIIGFNVKPDNTAKGIAERENVDVRLYRVIYNAIEDVEAAMKGMLEPVFEEKIIGHAEVRQTFKASGVGMIAGSYILDGKFQRGCTCRVSRDGEILFDGALASLKRFKDDVKEVNSGYECGLVFEKFNDIKEGDQVEAYIMEEVPR